MPFIHGTSVCQDVAGELPAAPHTQKISKSLAPYLNPQQQQNEKIL
jgi:hypothetical protein